MSDIGSIDRLPAELRDAVKRALVKDAQQGAGDISDLVVLVALAVWRAGVKRGRELERRQRSAKKARA
jgi:hypothetical protein